LDWTNFLTWLNIHSTVLTRNAYITNKKSYIFPTQSVYVFSAILALNSVYFIQQHQLTGFYNGDGLLVLTVI
jgi:hypothetical protein